MFHAGRRGFATCSGKAIQSVTALAVWLGKLLPFSARESTTISTSNSSTPNGSTSSRICRATYIILRTHSRDHKHDSIMPSRTKRPVASSMLEQHIALCPLMPLCSAKNISRTFYRLPFRTSPWPKPPAIVYKKRQFCRTCSLI